MMMQMMTIHDTEASAAQNPFVQKALTNITRCMSEWTLLA